MRKVTSVSLDESSILILCSHEWLPTQFVLQCDQWFHYGWIFFFSSFITFRTNVWMSIIPSPCSFFFALHLEWCINLITNKKSNEICIFANICIFLLYLVCGSNFLQLSSTFCRNAQKKKREQKLTEKNLNADRQFFKFVIRILWCYFV